MTLRVEIEALRRDANAWAGTDSSMADTMRTAAAVGDTQLPVALTHFSGAGISTGLATTYEALRQKAVRLMGEAAAHFESIADTLDTAADEYERVDGGISEDIRKVWRVKEDE